MIKLLTFSTLFPNVAQPAHGKFVENRLRHLLASGEVSARVIAPVPWLPFRHKIMGHHPNYSTVPQLEQRAGIEILHPRYVVIPKIGMSVAPTLLAAAAKNTIKQVINDGFDFDVLDAHYFYPDGVAAAMLADWLGKPVVITGRGTDLNLIPKYKLPRRQIRWAAAQAQGLITVCQALKNSLVELGVPQDRVTVLRNGVDLELFKPIDRQAARAKWRASGLTLISVGLLIDRKGHHHVIRALQELPEFNLLIAGDGPDREKLEALAAQIGVSERVRFLGNLMQPELRELYEAADALVLASSREGWANVLLEAMACGTPVIASNIWGTPEVVADPAAGVLMPHLNPAGVVAGVRTLFAAAPNRVATRSYAERFSWDDTTRGQLALFNGILGKSAGGK
ncbi:MAG: glycosyltransferase family 4 protein [Rhodobacteraceae bacterium]|nr:glycosyltransferase family 4 protein [Paracoccaceae bacterium]